MFVATWQEGIPLHHCLFIASVYAACTYFTAIVIGIPARLLFARWHWTRLWQYITGGVLIGLVPLILFWYLVPIIWKATPYPSGIARMLLLFCGTGIVSAVVFWFVDVGRGRAEAGG